MTTVLCFEQTSRNYNEEMEWISIKDKIPLTILIGVLDERR